jgi:hypothetical protein
LHGNNHRNPILAYQEPHKKMPYTFEKAPWYTGRKTENGGFCSFINARVNLANERCALSSSQTPRVSVTWRAHHQKRARHRPRSPPPLQPPQHVRVRKRASERRAASGGRRPAGGGRPTDADGGMKPATQVATARRNRASGGGLCVIARGIKEQKPPFSGFSASVPWGLFKSIWCFFCVLLGRQGSRSCGYFNAKMRGSRRTAKSDRSKAALLLIGAI